MREKEGGTESKRESEILRTRDREQEAEQETKRERGQGTESQGLRVKD